MKLTTVTPREPSDSEIQCAAYLLWLDSGRPASHDRELWFAAREMLCHQHAPHAKTYRGALELATSAPADPKYGDN